MTYFMLCSPGPLTSHPTLMVPPMWSLNMSNTNVIGLNSFTNLTPLDPIQLPMWPPWTSFTKVTKTDFYFIPICPTWLLPMCPRWDCWKSFTNMSAPPVTTNKSLPFRRKTKVRRLREGKHVEVNIKHNTCAISSVSFRECGFFLWKTIVDRSSHQNGRKVRYSQRRPAKRRGGEEIFIPIQDFGRPLCCASRKLKRREILTRNRDRIVPLSSL